MDTVSTNEMLSATGLCGRCEKWDPQKYLFPGNFDDIRFTMRMDTFDYVQNNRLNCKICDFKYKCISKLPGLEDAEKSRSAQVIWDHQPFAKLTKKDDNGSIMEEKLVARIVLQLYTNSQSQSVKYTSSIFACGVQVAAPDQRVNQSERNQTLMLGRRIENLKVDISLIKSWIYRCGKDHASCKIERDTMSFPGFRLIDVRNYCVVNTVTPGHQYAALSYVWGGIKQLTLTQQTQERLTTPGGLGEHRLDIAQSIKDSIQLCRMLGLDYLWVDSLCIQQDDDNDRRVQIENMGQIYAAAALTIVTLSATDANSALPGIVTPRPTRTQQHRINIKGLDLVTTQIPLLASIRGSIWDTRGWCFQEKILSKKLLFIASDQCFFHCNEATWYEDAFLEVDDPHVTIDIEPYEGTAFRRDLLKPPPSSSFEETRRIMTASYAYRSLTKDEDAMNAFRGVQNWLRKKFGSNQWIFGMPRDHFGLAMTWRWHNHWPHNRRSSVPSWCWSSWKMSMPIRDNLIVSTGQALQFKGIVHYYLSNDSQNMEPVEAYEKVEQDGDGNEARLEHLGDSWLAHLQTPTNKDRFEIATSLPKRSYPLLYFYTSSVKLHVDRQGDEKESRHGCTFYEIRSMVDGPSFGKICLNIDWRESQPDIFEFIVLAEYLSTGGKHSLRSGVITIMIQWHESIAERIQMVNQPIAASLWMTAKPDWKQIILG